MKAILSGPFFLLGAIAFIADLQLAGLGLVLLAAVLLIGDVLQALPEPACNQDCSQGDNCTCQLVKRERPP